MDRRTATKTIAALLAGAGTAQAATTLYTTATPEMMRMIPRPLDKDVRFTYGVAAARLPDGSWNVTTRAAAQGKKPRAIVRLRLDVATDKAFSQIILSQAVNSQQKKAYLVRLNVRPKVTNNLLYFRFVVLEPPANVADATGRTSLATAPDSLRRSPIGEMNPWMK